MAASPCQHKCKSKSVSMCASVNVVQCDSMSIIVSEFECSMYVSVSVVVSLSES